MCNPNCNRCTVTPSHSTQLDESPRNAIPSSHQRFRRSFQGLLDLMKSARMAFINRVLRSSPLRHSEYQPTICLPARLPCLSSCVPTVDFLCAMCCDVQRWPNNSKRLLTCIWQVAIGWALVNVMGIPLSESQALRICVNDYREYQLTSNAFVSWYPRPRQERYDSRGSIRVESMLLHRCG